MRVSVFDDVGYEDVGYVDVGYEGVGVQWCGRDCHAELRSAVASLPLCVWGVRMWEVLHRGMNRCDK